jgi:hypothetical protein
LALAALGLLLSIQEQQVAIILFFLLSRLLVAVAVGVLMEPLVQDRREGVEVLVEAALVTVPK